MIKRDAISVGCSVAKCPISDNLINVTMACYYGKNMTRWLRTNWCMKVIGGSSITVADSSRPALFKHPSIAVLISSEMKGRMNGILFSLLLLLECLTLPLNSS
ncbi:hypothetical protein KIN20_027735 [Parelaphostrongylus tenuis]|uniref:Uncharacterized protein n=1 Tax=Parelaphostrongylus tenuis TaxID=148309 RepID=A0AAD5WE13_PARTN|nr:hypothetical protein KIN20_027735 [Parelaphostrongylus tenuis]